MNTVRDVGGGQYGEIGDFIQSGNYRITELQAALFIGQFSRLEQQNAHRRRQGALLDALLEDIDGVLPMKGDPRETKKVYFNYTFRYDAYDIGLDTAEFRTALTQRLGFDVSSCYQPLNNCSLYRPLTKKRHRLGPSYERAIDPSRFHVPVAERIYRDEAVNFPHRILLCSDEQTTFIADTIKELLNDTNV